MEFVYPWSLNDLDSIHGRALTVPAQMAHLASEQL